MTFNEALAVLRAAGYEFQELTYYGLPQKYRCRIVSLTEKVGDWPKYYTGERVDDPIEAIESAMLQKYIEDNNDLA